MRGKILVFSFMLCALSFTPAFAQEKSSLKKPARDPFIPLVTPDGRLLKFESEKDKPEISVEGIMQDKSGLSYALINGSVVKIGDLMGEFQVFKILDDRVIFLKEGQPIEVKLKKEE